MLCKKPRPATLPKRTHSQVFSCEFLDFFCLGNTCDSSYVYSLFHRTDFKRTRALIQVKIEERIKNTPKLFSFHSLTAVGMKSFLINLKDVSQTVVISLHNLLKRLKLENPHLVKQILVCYVMTFSFFISSQSEAPALKGACIFKIFRCQSYLTDAQWFDQIDKL